MRKQTARKSICSVRVRVRRVLATADAFAPQGPTAAQEAQPAPGPTAAQAAQRAPGLLLGFPVTPSGAVAGGASDEWVAPPAPVAVSLDAVNARSQLQSSLGGPVLRMKGEHADAPADGTKGGLSRATKEQLDAVAQQLRARQPNAPFAVLMLDSDDPSKLAVARSDARVPCATANNVIVEFGVADFQAAALAFLDGATGTRPIELLGCRPDPTLSCGVYATRDLRVGEPVDYDSGLLWECPDFDTAMGVQSNQQLHSHELSSAVLKPFGYTGPDLVSEMTTLAGYNLYFNDPSFYKSPSLHAAEVKANIAAFMVMDLRPSARSRIGIMYFTTRAVAKGEELLQDWGGDTWDALNEMYLDGQARTSHWYHRYEMKLRVRALSRGVDVTPEQLAQQVPVSGESVSFNPSEGGMYGIADYVVDNVGAAGAPNSAYVSWCAKQREEESLCTLPVDEGLRLLPDSELPAAFAAANCERTETTDVSHLSPATRARLAAYAPYFKKPPTETMSKMLRGTAPLKVCVAEVMATYSPPRWISAPDTPALALVVRPGKRLEHGDVVCLYAGQLLTLEAFDAKYGDSAMQYYSYDLPPGWWPGTASKLPKPQSLVIDAARKGGVGRFINDCWGRAGGKRTVNVEPRAVWDPVLRVPTIVMVVTKPGGIDSNEEVVCDYGPAFWKIVWRHLRVLHTDFWRHCAARVTYLRGRLDDEGVPRPKYPDALAGPRFIGCAPHLDAAQDDGEDAELSADDDSDGDAPARVRARSDAGAGSVMGRMTSQGAGSGTEDDD